VARGRAARGPTPWEYPGTPGWPLSCRHGGVTGWTGHNAPAPVDPADHGHHDGARTGRVVLRNMPGLAVLEHALREQTGRGAATLAIRKASTTSRQNALLTSKQDQLSRL